MTLLETVNNDSENNAGVNIVLVSGIPGTGVLGAIGKLQDWMKGDLEATQKRWKVLPKFEDLLVKQHVMDTPGKTDSNLIQLLGLPKPVLRFLWANTITRLQETLDHIASSADVVFLPIHLVWFHQLHREYISVLDRQLLVSELMPHKICHVLCLIDDVHDIYERLRQPRKLYSRQFLRTSSQDAKKGPSLIRHLEILDWRAREVAESESVASHLQIPFTLLAVKHPPKVAYFCLKGVEQVYLSHAITEVRRLERSKSNSNHKLAETFKNSLWDFQETLSKRIAVLQPTCIDELRLNENSSGVSLDARFYLRTRYTDSMFRYDDSNIVDVIYDDIKDDQCEFSDIDVAIAHDRSNIVKTSIIKQISSRDLAMVTQAEHLIVYRPRFHGALPGGVNKEIDYFKQITKLKGIKGRSIVYLDCEEDKSEFVPRQFLEAIIQNAKKLGIESKIDLQYIVDYQSNLRDATRAAIRAAVSSNNLQDIGNAVSSILKDLELDPEWTFGEATSPKPLSSTGTLTYYDQRINNFLYSLTEAAKPFEDRLHVVQRTVWIDNKNPNELCDEIMDIINGV